MTPAQHATIPPDTVSAHKTRRLPLRVGTRASPLAIVQTRAFLQQIMHFCPVLRSPFMGDTPVFQEHLIRTTGDIVQNRRLAEIGGKGLFAKEIHEALADGRIDFAVHSLKDLETDLPPGIVLACTLPREDARDALVLPPDSAEPDPRDPFAVLARASAIGTSSVRRQAQLLHARPDLRIELIRGNVQTRLDKVHRGEFAATFLAYAGLRRLGLDQHASLVIAPELMLPAACQGIVGVTVREENTELRSLLSGIEDTNARAVSTAERAMLKVLDGSCRTPIGGFARLLPDGTLRLTGLTASEDGTFLLKRSLDGASADAERIGKELGASLRADSPDSLFLP
jgi:hydroxymethylbilane synthase